MSPDGPSRSRASKRTKLGRLGRLAQRASALALCGMLAGCAVTPVTGKNVFISYPLDFDREIGASSYAEILSDAQLIKSGAVWQRASRITERLLEVTDDPGFEWELAVIRDDQTINAFALPGGKIAVYTGLMNLAQSDGELAAVLGHEIGHVVARHSVQRLQLEQARETALGIGLQTVGENYENLAKLAPAATEILISLPFSRSEESEADHIGLIYMARAGYDPSEAIRFWERMAALKQPAGTESAGSGGGVVETIEGLFSTHPSDGARIKALTALLPLAKSEYKPR